MDISFKQQNVGETAYLVMDMEEYFKVDSFAMNMMARNRMAGIIQVQIVQMNERKLLQFNITGLMKLNGWLARPRAKKETLMMFNSLLNAFEEADAYMLDMEHLFLDWEYVYLDGQGNCMLLYLPFDYASRKDKITFLQEIVSRVQPDYQEKDPYLFDILNAFSRGGIRKLSDFREILKKSVGVREEAPLDEGKPAVREAGPVQPMIQREEAAMVPKQEGRDAGKKVPLSPKIPVINIPGREPGAKPAAPETMQRKQETEGKGFRKNGKGKKDAGKEDIEKKDSRKESRKSIFKKDGKKQRSFLIPGKQKKEENAVEDNRIVSGGAGAGKDRTGNRQDGLYESYENTVVMQEPASMYAGMQPSMQAEAQPGAYAGMQEGMRPGIQLGMQPSVQFGMQAYMPENMGTGMQADGEVTVVLEEDNFFARPVSCLRRRQDGMVYRIEKERVMIGSGTGADICIYNNPAISRSHAMIFCINGDYYMEDNQSKNGSFINGRRLQPGVREPLYDGMILKLANEEFEFSKN